MARVSTFDYIVVGAGSAGCVVAGRLGAHSPTLLLEAGGPDSGVQDGVDVGALIDKPDNLILSWSSPVTRNYPTEAQASLGGRSINIHRGVVRGGCHAINSMIHVRGNRRDYDTWAQLGNDGWSFDEVLPYFMMSEDFDGRPLAYDPEDRRYHGTGGRLPVRPLPNPTLAACAFIEAARECGFCGSRPEWDFNGRQQEDGAGLYQGTVTADGRRASTASAYLDARGGWGTGFRSCAAWLSWRVGLDLGAARERVRVARALGLPGLAQALARGELSYAKVRALLPPLLRTDHRHSFGRKAR